MIELIKRLYWRWRVAKSKPVRIMDNDEYERRMAGIGLIRSPYTGSWVTPEHIKRQRDQYNPLGGYEQ